VLFLWTVGCAALAVDGGMDDGVVTRVVDGDTFVVSVGGTEHKVRVIGVDTPETSTPEGDRVADEVRARLSGREVRLERDVSETDRYGRLLRHVWITRGGEWTLLSRDLVHDGLAHVYTVPPDVRWAEELVADQREAREARRGLWADAEPAFSGPCDPAYPTVCVPSPPPRLTCRDIAERRFEVRAPDPHHFDGNGDGVGCESP
jgi:micrococcal nuclease